MSPETEVIEPGPRARLGWALFALVLTTWVVVALAVMESGLGGDPRVTNPNPEPSTFPHLLGSDVWVPNANAAAGLSSGLLLAVFLVQSLRQRKLHWGVIVFLSISFMGVLDPIANWATFTFFDPRIGHFPLDWPWMRFAPLLEPTFSFIGGYAAYYFSVSLGLYFLYSRLVLPRVKKGSFFDRRPLLSMSLTCFLVSLPIDVGLLMGWLRAGILIFTQGAGPSLHWGPVELPVGMVLYDSMPFLIVPLLCHRDGHGNPVVLSRLARLVPSLSGIRRDTSARRLVAATALMIGAGLVPFTIYATLRVTGHLHPSYDQLPSNEPKTYDPYGDLEDSGKEGPFYK